MQQGTRPLLPTETGRQEEGLISLDEREISFQISSHFKEMTQVSEETDLNGMKCVSQRLRKNRYLLTFSSKLFQSGLHLESSWRCGLKVLKALLDFGQREPLSVGRKQSKTFLTTWCLGRD